MHKHYLIGLLALVLLLAGAKPRSPLDELRRDVAELRNEVEMMRNVMLQAGLLIELDGAVTRPSVFDPAVDAIRQKQEQQREQ